jgi:hypothetical protein
MTLVTGNLFEVLGVVPALGRMLRPDDDRGTNGAMAVLSYPAWQRTFGGRPDIVGHTLGRNVGDITIVGVTPEGFDFPAGTDLWIPEAALARFSHVDEGPTDGYWDLVGRLTPHATLAHARADYAPFITAYESPRLGDATARRVDVRPYTDVLVGDQRPGLLILSAGVALVRLIARSSPLQRPDRTKASSRYQLHWESIPSEVNSGSSVKRIPHGTSGPKPCSH